MFRQERQNNRARSGNNINTEKAKQLPVRQTKENRAAQKEQDLKKFINDYNNISRQNNKTSTNKNVIQKVKRELQKYGFKLGPETLYTSILNKLRKQVPNSMKKKAENVNTISGIINLMKNEGNSNENSSRTGHLKLTKRVINFRNNINNMNLKQLFELLLKEFPDISKNFVNTYNDTKINHRIKLYYYTQRKLKIYYEGLLEHLHSKTHNEKYLMAISTLNNITSLENESNLKNIRNDRKKGVGILRLFFNKLAEFSSELLKEKKWYGKTPLPGAMMRTRQNLQGKNKKNTRPLSQRALNKKAGKYDVHSKATFNYNTNSNNKNSSNVNAILKHYNSKTYNELTTTNNNNLRLNQKDIGVANIDMKTFMTLNILLWMDQKHDFKNSSNKIKIENNFFDLLENEGSTFYTIFPQYIHNNKNIIKNFTKTILENNNNSILNTLCRLKILNYEVKEDGPSLTINSKMEEKIKENFQSFLTENNKNKTYQLNVISHKNKLNDLIDYISIDSESSPSTAFSSIPTTKRYVPLERVLDPGYGFSPNKYIVNFIKTLTPKKDLPKMDFQIRKYKIKVNNRNINIGYNNNKIYNTTNYKPVLKINNVNITIGESRQGAQRGGDAKNIWSKTFGDFMQILAIASRDCNKKPVHYGTFDTTSALIYLFVRRHVYKKNNINLALQKNSTTVLIIN
jgi:hypothetical protein